MHARGFIKSAEFLKALDRYDEWLMAEVKAENSKISIDGLREKYSDEIAEIFGWHEHNSSKKTTGLLKYYKVVLGIGAASGNDVQIAEGIYFDESDFSYCAGDVNGLNKGTKDRSNVIRQFQVIYGDTSKLDPYPLLEALSVQFVRYNRYTVYPFPFHLLDIYFDDVILVN